MSDGASGSARSLEIARGLLLREASRSAEAETIRLGAPLQRMCSSVSESLHDAMGAGGRAALFARALASTEARHPVLAEVRTLHAGEIRLDRVAASVEAHGLPAVTAAIEALMAALIEILTRLIGEDMAVKLMDRHAEWPGMLNGTEGP